MLPEDLDEELLLDRIDPEDLELLEDRMFLEVFEELLEGLVILVFDLVVDELLMVLEGRVIRVLPTLLVFELDLTLVLLVFLVLLAAFDNLRVE